METEVFVKAAGVAVALLAGAGTKHRTKVNHKAAGSAQNAGIAALTTLASDLIPGVEMTAKDGLEVWMASEAIYNAARGARHALRPVGSALRLTGRGFQSAGRLLTKLWRW